MSLLEIGGAFEVSMWGFGGEGSEGKKQAFIGDDSDDGKLKLSLVELDERVPRLQKQEIQVADASSRFSSVNSADLELPGFELEKNALRHALEHSLTPRGMGRQGCMVAIDEYVLKPYFGKHGINAPDFESTYKFIDWFERNNMGKLITKSIAELKVTDLLPGDIVIPQKVDGSQHAMVVSRVPESWNYPPQALMFNGNTGLNFADANGKAHFRAAQEVIGPGTEIYNHHHGQINSHHPQNPYLGGKVKILRFQ